MRYLPPIPFTPGRALAVLVVLAALAALLWWFGQEALSETPQATPTPFTVETEPGAGPDADPVVLEPAVPMPVEPIAAHDSLDLGLAAPPAGAAFSNEKVTFAVKVKDEVNPYRVLGVFVMPGETLDLEAVFTERPGNARLVSAQGKFDTVAPGRWTWTAPAEPGLYPVRVSDTMAGETITLNVFVMVPFDHQSESLNGYQIGRYEATPLRGDPAYNRPRGFIELNAATRDALVSPHFTLSQFRCKQTDEYPQYLVLRERMLLKLEMLLEEVNQANPGTPVHTLHVMSGFRTPHYNASIGNETSYSRHLYGDAADVFVDVDDDNYMDDLDDDGQVTRDDAVAMAGIVEAQMKETWYQPFIGGLGIYSPASHRGPFIHVDVRGQHARW